MVHYHPLSSINGLAPNHPLSSIIIWLVVWNMAFIFPCVYIYTLGMSSSQLTNLFFRGVGIPPTRLKREVMKWEVKVRYNYMIIYYPPKNYPLKFTPIHKPLTNHPPFRSAIDKPVVKYWILGSTPYRSQAHLNWQATHVFGAPEDPDSEDEVLFFCFSLVSVFWLLFW